MSNNTIPNSDFYADFVYKKDNKLFVRAVVEVNAERYKRMVPVSGSNKIMDNYSCWDCIICPCFIDDAGMMCELSPFDYNSFFPFKSFCSIPKPAVRIKSEYCEAKNIAFYDCVDIALTRFSFSDKKKDGKLYYYMPTMDLGCMQALDNDFKSEFIKYSSPIISAAGLLPQRKIIDPKDDGCLCRACGTFYFMAAPDNIGDSKMTCYNCVRHPFRKHKGLKPEQIEVFRELYSD